MAEQLPGFDIYRELEVDRGASPETIEAAWRSMARRNHPDTSPDKAAATERIKRLNVAHDWLSDSSRRERYDRAHAHDQSGPSRSPATREEPRTPGMRGGALPRTPVSGRTAVAIRAVMLRARLLSADEIRRLVAAREARWQRWDDAYDAVERWKAQFVSQARNARAADRRRSKVDAYGDEAFGAAYWRAKDGHAWALAGDAGMAAKEAVEALLTRSILTAEEFTAYFGAWAEVIGEPSPRYFVGAPLGQLVLLSIRRLGRAAKAWLGRQPATIQLFVLAMIVLVLLALFRAI